jgi:replication factor C subunit 3/5
MEKTRLNNLFPLTPSSTFSTKKGRSGYEPSDTETEWQDTPRYERGGRKNVTLSPEETRVTSVRNKSPMTLHKRRPSRFEFEVPPSPSVIGSVLSQPRRRHHSKSPYRPRIAQDDGNNDDDDSLSYITGLNSRRNTSPLPRPDFGRTLSPYNRTHEQRIPSNENRKASSGLLEVDRASTKPNYRRAVTAPRLRDQEQTSQNTRMLKQREKSPFKTGPVREREINEMIAQVKLSKNPTDDYSSALESTDSIQTGDLFFSRECNALQAKNSSLPIKVQQYGYFSPRPVITDINSISNPSEIRGNLNKNMPRNSSSNVLLSRTTRVTSIRKGSGTGKTHTNPSVKSDASAKTTDSMRKFTSNRKKNQKDAWFACMRTGNCKISRKSPERKPIDEASLIERAIIVESIPQFWADKHQPASLDGFICNKQEAQLLKELVCLLFLPNTQMQFLLYSFIVVFPYCFCKVFSNLRQIYSVFIVFCSKDIIALFMLNVKLFYSGFLVLQVSSQGSCPHILLKGPSGSEKRELAMALLREIYGDACSNVCFLLLFSFYIMDMFYIS